MIATIVLAALAALDTCAQCRLEGDSAVLCELHAKEEREVLARAGRRLAAKVEAERLSALDAIAALTDAHANAPSERVVQSIAAALDDDSYAVRARALERLGRPQHAHAALAALAAALADSRKEHERLDEQLGKLEGKLGDELSGSRMEKVLDEFNATRQERLACVDWRNALVARLGDFPDERAQDAILRNTQRNLLVFDDEPLVRLGTRTGVRAVIESLRAAELDIARAEQERDEHAGEPSPVTTLGMNLRELRVLEMQMLMQLRQTRLATAFVARGLAPPPFGKDAMAWGEWLEQNIDAFSERPPGIASPAW